MRKYSIHYLLPLLLWLFLYLMSKHKEFPEQADDLQRKRHFKECTIGKLTFTGHQLCARQLGMLNRVWYLNLHNNLWDRHYYCLVINEEVEAQFNQSMVSHPISDIAEFYIEVRLTPKSICYAVFLQLCSLDKQNLLTSQHLRTPW